MSNVIKFTSIDDFLEELHSDIEQYAIAIVKTVRISEITESNLNVYVIASYVRSGEIVKVIELVGPVTDADIHEKAEAKIDYIKDVIKGEEEDIELKKGEYVDEEDEEDSIYVKY